MNYTIKTLLESYREGTIKPDKIFDLYKKKIETENPELNAFLKIFDKPAGQNSGTLSGIPCAIKDNMLIKGAVATAGSKILKNYVASYDATAIRKLRNAGAVFMGKTNLDEFAMGSSTENSAFGPVRNPHNKDMVAGGSSGGSAAAVAADLAVFALGSDTGGSIRQPASLCGVVGLKPTYGRVSRSGLIAMASSLDQIGPITKNVFDAAYVLNVIAGKDIHDSTTADIPVPDFTLGLDREIKGLRVGVPREFFGKGLEKEVEERVLEAIEKMRKSGAIIQDISLPHTEYALATYYILMPSEVSANLSRFDGIRYGYSSPEAKDIQETYFKSRGEGFGPEPRRRILLGTYALSSGYYDAYYLKAQKVRALIRKDFEKAFEEVDIIVGPTSPTVAFRVGEKAEDPLAMYLSDIYTVPVNLAGLPAISIPCGTGSKSGLPVGFQIIGNMFDESTILRAATSIEK